VGQGEGHRRAGRAPEKGGPPFALNHEVAAENQFLDDRGGEDGVECKEPGNLGLLPGDAEPQGREKRYESLAVRDARW
jgi:hypothetical protein